MLREGWAFALPFHQENFGVAVLEAVAAGLPVVISGEVQLRSFIEEKELGRIVDRTDPAAIAAGLRAVLLYDAGRRRAAAGGRGGAGGGSGGVLFGADRREIVGTVRQVSFDCVSP
ncbi:glycosyltransferase involved in cell wall biosynthesis [Salinibacter ruber]|uniref:glycosyltransferase n=1 Tax=Salinibacter ruber TaxID=146919 RepID=UPI00216A68C1|nr:glycosyltransferase involved in cell wall biosynthesis [Salinibacter ruber]